MRTIVLTCVCLVVGVHPIVGAQSSSGSAQTAKTTKHMPVTSGTQPSVHRAPALAPTSIPQDAGVGVGAKRTTVTPTSAIRVDQHKAAPNLPAAVGVPSTPALRAPNVTPKTVPISVPPAPAATAPSKPRVVPVQPARP
jgi:hypothetical protein